MTGAQILIVLSSEAEANIGRLGFQLTQFTHPECPFSVSINVPVFEFQT